MDIAVTKMSSKGQIVIPAEMRTNIKEGEKIVIIRTKDQLILEKVSKLGKKLEEDIIFAKKTEEAWKRYERGEFIEMELSEFLKKMKKW